MTSLTQNSAAASLAYELPLDRRVARLEKHLTMWRVIAILHMAVALVLMMLIAFMLLPRQLWHWR